MTERFGYLTYKGVLQSRLASQNFVSAPSPNKKWAPKLKVSLHFWIWFHNWEPPFFYVKNEELQKDLAFKIWAQGLVLFWGVFYIYFVKRPRFIFLQLVVPKPPWAFRHTYVLPMDHVTLGFDSVPFPKESRRNFVELVVRPIA